MARKKVTRTLCADGTYAHHWMIGEPHYHWKGSIEGGTLLEDTHQVCKKCDIEKDNTTKVIIDDDD